MMNAVSSHVPPTQLRIPCAKTRAAIAANQLKYPRQGLQYNAASTDTRISKNALGPTERHARPAISTPTHPIAQLNAKWKMVSKREEFASGKSIQFMLKLLSTARRTRPS